MIKFSFFLKFPLILASLVVGSLVVINLATNFFEFQQALVLAGLALVLSSLFIGFIMAAVTRKALTKFKKAIDLNLAGEVGSKIDFSSGDELGDLAKKFNQLADFIKTRGEEKANIESLFYDIGEGVMAVNLKEEIILFNRVAEEICQYKKKDIFGQNFSLFVKFFAADKINELTSFVSQAILKNQTQVLPKGVLLLTQTVEIPVAAVATPLKDPAGLTVGAIVVFRNITAEIEAERLKADLISIASHQLKTPLAEIKGLVELLTTEGEKLTQEQREYLADINNSAVRMLALVSDFLDVTRIEQEALNLKFQPVDLGQIVKKVYQDLLPTATGKNQQMTIETGVNLPKVAADPDKIREVAVNLIDNAIKYTPDKGKIEIRVRKVDNQVEFSVKDSGVAIPKSEQSKVFIRFAKIVNPKSQQQPGTGLGLYIVKQLTEKQRGQIRFESEEGKGTTFTVSFPLILPE